jgi:hypothetical protein
MSLLRACSVGVLSSVLAAGAIAQMAAQGPPAAPPPEATLGSLAQDPEPQPPAEPPPGYIVAVEGAAVLERNNTTDDAIAGMPLMAGDRLRSEGGSLEIKWAERSTLRLARYTELDILSGSMIRLPRGAVQITLLTSPGQSAHDQLSIDGPGASVRFYGAGDYRIAISGTDAPDVELAVVRGSAQLVSDRGQLMLAAGERSLVRDGAAPTAVEGYTADPNATPAGVPLDGEPPAPTYDPTNDIAAFQRSSAGGAYQGTSYLPTELYGYETVLGSAGSWSADSTYGNVWYPRVASDWRPYSRGRWQFLPRYGWTWIGSDRWSWPTHHYGRWGHGSRGWYWVPARHWGPAWVSWQIAPSYIGWCPLGWDGRPVFGFSVDTVVASRGYDPWSGWTVIPSGRFGRAYDVQRFRVDQRIISRDRPQFVASYGPSRHPWLPGSYLDRSPLDRARVAGGSPTGVERGSANYGGGVGSSRRGDGRPGNVSVMGAGPRGAGNDGGGAIDDREESPYDRALRVMGRRVDGNRGPDGNGDGNGSRQNDAGLRGDGRVDGNDGDNRGWRGGRDVSPNNDPYGNNGTVVGQPYYYAPGQSRPRHGDNSPGISQPTGGWSQPGAQPGGWTRPDAQPGGWSRPSTGQPSTGQPTTAQPNRPDDGRRATGNDGQPRYRGTPDGGARSGSGDRGDGARGEAVERGARSGSRGDANANANRGDATRGDASANDGNGSSGSSTGAVSRGDRSGTTGSSSGVNRGGGSGGTSSGDASGRTGRSGSEGSSGTRGHSAPSRHP